MASGGEADVRRDWLLKNCPAIARKIHLHQELLDQLVAKRIIDKNYKDTLMVG